VTFDEGNDADTFFGRSDFEVAARDSAACRHLQARVWIGAEKEGLLAEFVPLVSSVGVFEFNPSFHEITCPVRPP
jgi:hypothetical protein